MKPYKMSTRLLGTVAALSVASVGFAQTTQEPKDPAKNSISPEERVPSGTSYGQQPKNQARVPEMKEPSPAVQNKGTLNNQNAQSQSAPTPSTAQGISPPSQDARAPIDPQEVQQVFGQQASLVGIKSLSQNDAKALQQRLKDLGYYKGTVDGMPGPQTRAALNSLVRSQFVLTQRLVEQGQMPSQLATSLGLSEVQPTSGIDSSLPSQSRGSTTPEGQTRGNARGQTQHKPLTLPPPASNDSPPAFDPPSSSDL